MGLYCSDVTREQSQNSPLTVCFSQMHMSLAPEKRKHQSRRESWPSPRPVCPALNVPLVEGRHLLPDDLSPTGYHDFYVEGSSEPIAMLYSEES